MRKNILALLLGLSLSTFAQEQVSETFDDIRVVNGHSVETNKEGSMTFIIAHRFGMINGGLYELYGLDESNIRIGFDYGLTNRLTVGIGRSSFQKTVDGFVKFKVLSQKTEGGSPITLTWLSTSDYNTLKEPYGLVGISGKLRWSFSHQLLVAKKFGERLSIQVMPTFLHRNLTPTSEMDNDIFSIGSAGRVRLTQMLSFKAEYYFALPNQFPDANGKKSKYISRFYTCTSCHSPVKEDPIVSSFDPQVRLDYAEKNGLKFLQGSTFYGIANRESWYNDDYEKKYGDLVKPARNSLAESTQLCAKICSSGRYLEDWELEAILAYFWNNQLKIKDLKLSEKELKSIQDEENKREAISLLKSKFAVKPPATFGESPQRQDLGFEGITGDPINGKKVYELSCMSCHQDGGISGIAFTNSKLDFQKFKRSIGKKTDYNLYDIVRKGTYAGQGKPRYMPLYPKERMSDQQLEDLRAYIEQEAK